MTDDLNIADIVDLQTPEGLTSAEDKLVWILGDLMNAVENYFGRENPKRLGHINSAAIRIVDEIITPLRDDGPRLQAALDEARIYQSEAEESARDANRLTDAAGAKLATHRAEIERLQAALRGARTALRALLNSLAAEDEEGLIEHAAEMVAARRALAELDALSGKGE